jgi:hypothetical protein
LKTWEDANREKIKAVLNEYETKLKTEEQWPKLSITDGR